MINQKISTRKTRLSMENAQEVAISGLAFLAGNDDLLGRFLAMTGLAAEDLRSAASDPAFLIGVLDFYLGYEPTLIEFATATQTDPEIILTARQILAGPEEVW